MIFELLILIALCTAGYFFLFHKKSGSTSSTSQQDNDTILKNPTLDQKNTQEMVVGLTDNITQKEVASPEIKTAPPIVIPTQEEPQEAKEEVSQRGISQERLPSFVENSNIQKEDVTETKEFVPTEVEQSVFDKEIVDKQPVTALEERPKEEQGALLQEIFENKAVEEKEILPDVQADENILKEVQEEAVYEKPQEEYNVDVQKELTRPEEEVTVPKETEIFSEEQQETPKEIEEAHQELDNKPDVVDMEKSEIGTEAYEQKYEAEKEKTEQEVVNPFVDEQVTTDEKPIFEDIQREDVLNKEIQEISPVGEKVEENLFASKDQEIAVGDFEKPEMKAETFEQEYEAETEKVEEVVNPFVDEQQVITDEKPIFEEIQQEDLLKKESEELPPVENIEENLFVSKDQEIAVSDIEKAEVEVEIYEQEDKAEKEKAEEVVNPFADEQVTTDEKPIFENIQQEDILKKEAEELPPVVEDIEENLFVTKDQEIAVGDVEKPEMNAETYEHEYQAEKEKAEEVVNPFVDEQQVTTDEKPIFEDIQQEDILKKEVFEPVVENIAVETQEEEKPFIELAEVSAPIEEPTKHEVLENQQYVPEPIETLQDQEIKTGELIEEEAVKPITEEEESPAIEDVQIEENPFVHNQVEEVIAQEEEKPIIETPIISELQQQPFDTTEALKIDNREEFLAKELGPVSGPVHVEEAQKETVQEDMAEIKGQEVQTSAKKVTRKGFNFRTNKTKIESIMPKSETPEKQNISEINKATEEAQAFPTPLTFEEKEERIVEDLINELGTPIQLVKYQSSEIETPFILNEQEKIETQPEPELPVEKTTVKRGFNFRTKKNKIESILQEGSEKSSSGEILKESLVEEPQVQKEHEPFIKEIETIQVPEIEEKEIEPVSEPVKVDKAPTKRGFNFRANKSKIESLEKSLSQEDAKLPRTELPEEKSLEVLPVEEKPVISNEEVVVLPTQEEPQIQNDLFEEKPLKTLPVEEKPIINNEEVPMIPTQEEPQVDKISSKRGFNFRTKKNKIEAMLTTSVDTPEKKPVVEGSEKSSGEFHSSMQQQEISAAFEEKQEEIEQKVLPETSPIKRVESLPAAEQATLEEERDLKAKTMGGAKRSFNFRGNKRRIDSILKKDSSGHLDLSGAEDQNSLSNILESTVNTSMTHSTEDVLGQREENIISLGEETIEPQTKRKGFNFRNAKKKTVIESPQKQDENLIVSGIIEESPQKSENVLAESGKGEVKKSKGFNFRNPNRVKAD